MRKLQKTIDRINSLITRLEYFAPAPIEKPDWQSAIAFRWIRIGRQEGLQAIHHPSLLRLSDIRCIDRQKAEIDRNTRQFLGGFPANNALLWGARGTGKSSLIKALLNEYSNAGLRAIQVSKEQLMDLQQIVVQLDAPDSKFILFCDDLSFEAQDPGYKSLKAALDGSLYGLPDNVLIYATSNRRHLLPEFNEENLVTRYPQGEIHFAESVEEKISLSDRFGLWLSFHPFTQNQYLEVVNYWLEQLDTPIDDFKAVREEALRWALKRGSRSGRTAWQFAKDWNGQLSIAKI